MYVGKGVPTFSHGGGEFRLASMQKRQSSKGQNVVLQPLDRGECDLESSCSNIVRRCVNACKNLRESMSLL